MSMGKVLLDMAMSLDGFAADRDKNALYPVEKLRNTPALDEIIKAAGAVVMGRQAYDMAEGDFTGYEYQVPIFVLTHDIPEKVAKGENGRLKFTFVTEGIERAVEQAKSAAVDKNVTVIGGIDTAQQCLEAGLLDELLIRLMPVLLNEGLRLFDNLGTEPIELEITNVAESPGIIHLRFRVIK
jgi:dihydrofolate reductase